MNLNELEELYISNQQEIEKLYNSNQFIWLKNNKNIEKEFYKYFVKYKIYESKRKSFEIAEKILRNKLDNIEQELRKRNNSDPKDLLRKKI